MAISSPWYTYIVPVNVHCIIANNFAVAVLYSGVESLPNRETDRATSWFYSDQRHDPHRRGAHFKVDRVPTSSFLHTDLPSRGDLLELGQGIVTRDELRVSIYFLLLKLRHELLSQFIQRRPTWKIICSLCHQYGYRCKTEDVLFIFGKDVWDQHVKVMMRERLLISRLQNHSNSDSQSPPL